MALSGVISGIVAAGTGKARHPETKTRAEPAVNVVLFFLSPFSFQRSLLFVSFCWQLAVGSGSGSGSVSIVSL